MIAVKRKCLTMFAMKKIDHEGTHRVAGEWFSSYLQTGSSLLVSMSIILIAYPNLSQEFLPGS